jgi:hypothetical protein
MRSAALAGVRFLARLLVVDAPRVLGGVDKSLLSQIAQGASHRFHLLSRGSVAPTVICGVVHRTDGLAGDDVVSKFFRVGSEMENSAISPLLS